MATNLLGDFDVFDALPRTGFIASKKGRVSKTPLPFKVDLLDKARLVEI
jgi:hypothetical protein